MEIQQLRFKDIRQVEGYWVFDINKADKGNRLKNRPSIRLLPIHSQLIDLGFLNWVNAQRAGQDESDRLFPLIHPKGSPLVSM